MDRAFFTSYVSRAGDLLEQGRVEESPRRTSPVFVRRSPSGQMFGRQAELNRARSLMEDGEPKAVGIVGSTGSGKTELLIRLAHFDDNVFSDGIIWLASRERPALDLLATIYDTMYAVSDARRRPNSEAVAAALHDLHLLVLLDDLDADRDLAVLRAAIPRATIVFTTCERNDHLDVVWIGLGGLALPDSVGLLQRILAPFVIPEHTAVSVAKALGSNPGRLLQVPASGFSPSELSTRIRSITDFDEHRYRQLSVGLRVDERGLLVGLALLGELALGAGTPSATLVKGGFVEYSTSGWSVAAGLRQRLVTEEFALELMLDRLSPILGNRERMLQRDQALLIQASAGTIELAARGNTAATIALGVPLAEALAERGAWATWSTLVRSVASAAEETGDAPTLSWALHQLGNRAACQGDRRSAKNALMRALELREDDLDSEALALTQQSLQALEQQVEEQPSDLYPVPHEPSQLPQIDERWNFRELARSARTVGVIAVILLVALVLGNWVRSFITSRPSNDVVAIATMTPQPSPVQATIPEAPQAAPKPTEARQTARPRPTANPTHKPSPKPTPRPTPRPTPIPTEIPKPKPAKIPAVVPSKLLTLIAHATSTPHGKATNASSSVFVGNAPHASVLRFTAQPSTIVAGVSSTICVHVAGAVQIVVTNLGRFDPTVVGCRDIQPKVTTVYNLTAISKDGRATNASVTVTVGTSNAPKVPSPKPSSK
ncbi:MAG TPA: NB-ARC domain-containing protein [Candidatus Baltobacteraceae bacterium]|nr:NB-ARC domain-containing protein [Candidatus Baltobacteraceae bacterium]